VSSTLHTHTRTHIHACRHTELSQVFIVLLRPACIKVRAQERKKEGKKERRDEFVVTALVDSAF